MSESNDQDGKGGSPCVRQGVWNWGGPSMQVRPAEF